MKNENKPFSSQMMELEKERQSMMKDLYDAIKMIPKGIKQVAEKAGHESQAVSQVLQCKYSNNDIVDAACEFLNEYYASEKKRLSTIKTTLQWQE